MNRRGFLGSILATAAAPSVAAAKSYPAEWPDALRYSLAQSDYGKMTAEQYAAWRKLPLGGTITIKKPLRYLVRTEPK